MLNSPQFHILGAGCGGTSLLAGLLDFHPQIEVGFELYAMQELFLGVQPKLLHDYWRFRMLRYCTKFNKFADSSNASLVGNKITTEQLSGLLTRYAISLDWRNRRRLHTICETLFTSQKLVLIVRDGRTCIPSKIKRGNHSLHVALSRWRLSVAIIKFLHHSSLATFLIRYEDLVSSPALSLASICDFLCVPYVPEMLNGTANPKMHPRYRSGNIYSTSGEEQLPNWVNLIIADDLSFFNYPSHL